MAKVSYRMTSDGKFIFPHRGNPPPLINGYRRDPGDAYVLIPDFISSCAQRQMESKILPCSKKVAMIFYCKHLRCITTPSYCNICTVEEGIKLGLIENNEK